MEEELRRGRQLITNLEYFQYQYFNGRTKWTTIKFQDLNLYMAYTYFGSPFRDIEDSDDIDENVNDIFECYKNDEKKCILNMIEVIKDNVITTPTRFSDIEVGFTATHSICKAKCDVCHNFPSKNIHLWFLLRIKLDHITVSYIDLHHKRIYKSWNDYLENNTLPKGFMFYPKSGFYEEENYLLQNLTPSSKKSEKILSQLDLVGYAANFASGVVLAGGLIFPILTPVLIPMAVTSGSFSLWEVGRQISKLKDLQSHSQSLVGPEAGKHWLNLAISALGLIAAPMTATVRTLELSNSAIMATNLGKSISILQKGACISHCYLGVFNLINVINNNSQVTLVDVMILRLDLFVIIGTLLPLSIVRNIMLCGKTAIESVYSYIINIPYCVMSEYIYKAICFVKKQYVVFMNMVYKFVENKLTPDKLLFAYEQFRKFVDFYKKQSNMLKDEDLLKHIVYDTMNFDCEESEKVKFVLCDHTMRELLKKIETKVIIDQKLITFCIDYIMEKSLIIASKYTESVADLIRFGIIDIDEIEKEFCKQYGIRQNCMSQYVLYSIEEISRNIETFLNAYYLHISEPENLFFKQLVHNETTGSKSLESYSLVAPCSDLNSNTCVRFAQTIDSQNHEYSNYEYLKPDPNVSILFSVSSFSIKIVFFSVHPVDGQPSMNISFYRDTQGSINNRLQCKDLKN